jgi:putative ABC transport system permease protein
VYVLSGISLLILVLACFNFMNLSTVHSLLRGKEVGLRKSVGANQGQLIRQFLGEAILLTLMAAVIR